VGIHAVSQPAVFLDRDGVINKAVVRDGKPYPPGSAEELEILPGVPEALQRLKAAGFALVVVTNQPDVARGTTSREAVEALNATLARRLPIDEFRVCYHDDADGCACRKPKPGLLLQPPLYDLGRSAMVGDRSKDIEAGRNASVRATVLVNSGHDEGCDVEPDLRADSLAQAVPWILTVLRRTA
jgi:D-glycero-D-manno-heptose 1,7-bisphosphate phosphatase